MLPPTLAGTFNAAMAPPAGGQAAYAPNPTTSAPASSVYGSNVLTNGDGSVFQDPQQMPIPAVDAPPPAGAIPTDPTANIVPIDSQAFLQGVIATIGNA